MEEGYRLANLLAESKKKLAKGKFEITNEFGDVDTLATQLRSQFGAQGMSKYIMFACKCMEEFYQKFTIKSPEGKHVMKDGYTATTFFDQVMGLITDFHRNQQRIDEKDINKYTFDTLTQKLQALPPSAGERKRYMKDKELAKKDSELVYSDNGIFAVRPLTTQSSCYYGQNPRLTNWCISTKSKLNYFKRYTEQEGKAFVITYFSGIPEGNKDHLITLEFDQDGDLTMIWDAPNKSQDPDDIYEIVERHLKGLQEKESADAIANFRDEPKSMTDAGLESKAFSIVEEILRESKEWIQHNPPPDPEQAIERRCQEAERMADEEYEFVSPHWELGNREPGQPPSVMFYANLEVLWDLDKPEYEDETGNVLLNKDYRFWRDFESKFSENLQKMGPPWSDMSGEINCYTEDNYAKLELRFDGYDSYHGDDAEGFEAFCAEDCRALENRGVQMQELMAAMLDAEAGVDRSQEYDDDDLYENSFYRNLESRLLGEEKGRSRQRGIYKFYCMIAYSLTAEGEKTRGLDDILADMRALPNVTIVTVAIRNQKVAEGRYIAGLAIKFIPSTPGDMNTPENVKARIVRDIKRLENVQSLFKLSSGLIRLE